MQLRIISVGLILLCMQACHTKQIHSVPFTPLKDPWLTPTQGVLFNESTPVYIVRKVNGQLEYLKYDNFMKPAMEYAEHLPEYQRAKVNSLIRNRRHLSGQVPQTPFVPTVLYPELMIVVGHDLYQKLNKDIWRTTIYLTAFYNGVDVVYHELENPKIRLNMAAIVIESEPNLFEYLKNSSVDGTKVQGSVMNDAGNFWYAQKDKFPLDSYDGVVLMTARGICEGGRGMVDKCDASVIGRAMLSGMCKYHDADKELKKIAVVTDDGHFFGVYGAAHELGHLLGVYHDGTLVSDKDDFSDVQSCNSSYANSNGYIMYPIGALSTRKHFWSDCSLTYLQRYLREENHTCLHNVPVSGRYSFPRFMPGTVIGNMNDLCRTMHYGKSCQDPQHPCMRMQCEKSETDNTCHILPREVLHGTACDENDPTKFCMVGECVSGKDFK